MGEFISAGGAILGGIINVHNGGSFFGEGFQAGGLIGGLVGGGYAAGKAAFRQAGGKAAGWAAARAGFSAGAKTFGVEATGAAIGFGYGMLSTGGDFQTSLMYANWGQMAPNAAKALARGGAGLYRKFGGSPSGMGRSAAARASLVNATDPVDVLTARAVAGEIANSSVGSRYFKDVVNTSSNLRFNCTEGITELGLFTGMSRGAPSTIDVFMRNAKSVRGAAGTFVHEARHMGDFYKGRQLGTQLAEYRAAASEFLFLHGRRPDRLARADLWGWVRANYSHLPLGR